ncbi:hypothetical protein [Cohnella terricola]|uniref:Uncharacterized protein n=1 Tax=Cohnella terricola TaxID=1289167 RepID=A0A559JDJ6_9BACL|nr:hypothetical protein [Cohnella terricola]TVX97945.1 hypothetical protein FPZ45_17010 [Cohnella terricola]
MIEQYNKLVEQEDRLLEQIETVEKCMDAIYSFTFKHEEDLNQATVTKLLVMLQSAQNEYRMELIHLRLNKMIFAYRLNSWNKTSSDLTEK